MDTKIEIRFRRHKRVRAKVKGNFERPRLSVFRSLKHIYAQLIDDVRGVTLGSAHDVMANISNGADRKERKAKKEVKLSKSLRSAVEVGKRLAEEANKKGIEKVVFDRGGYKYHGRIKALADGARAGGLRI